jgi:hypothetical protein
MQLNPWLARRVFAVVAALMIGEPAGAATAAGPFVGFEGLWWGNGVVTYASGTREPVRCRVQYVQNSVDNLQQALRCASDSYKFEINAYFEHANGTISGRWSEVSRDVSGTVTAGLSDGRIDGTLTGPGFAVAFVLTITGNRQSVTMESDEQEIRAVAINLRKTSN